METIQVDKHNLVCKDVSPSISVYWQAHMQKKRSTKRKADENGESDEFQDKKAKKEEAKRI